MRKQATTILLLLIVMPSANAALVRLDYAGVLVADLGDPNLELEIPVSGHFLLDPTARDDHGDPDDAYYRNALIGGMVTVGDVTHELTEGPGAFFTGVYVLNDSDNRGDFFAVHAHHGNGTFGFQLSDSTQSVFSDDSFPMSIDLLDFDPFVLGTTFGTVTYFTLYDGTVQHGFFTSASMRTVVPLPAAIWLLLPALALLGRRAR